MALFLKQPDKRSELQTKIATELREKMHAAQDVEAPEVDPAMMDDKMSTRGVGFLIIGIILIGLAVAAVWLAFE